MIKLYTVSEIAKLLKVKKNYVYDLIQNQELKAVKLSERRLRVTEEAIIDFLCRKETEGATEN